MNAWKWLSLPASVLLACQSVAAQKYSNTSTTSDDSTTIIRITSTKFITEFTTPTSTVTITPRPSGVASGTGSFGGPQTLDAAGIELISWTWTRKYNATTVGTVQIIINEATNKTTTTTKYHTEYKSNGTGTDAVPILSRTDINAAGTVTAVVQDIFNSTITLTYPTPFVQYTDMMSFYGDVPTTMSGQGTCCIGSLFQSGTPDHTPFAQPTTTAASDDPSGWLYIPWTGWDGPIPTEHAASTDITSLWGGPVQMTIPACPHTACHVTEQSAKPAFWNMQQVGIFATETTTLSIPDSSTSIADPVSATPSDDVPSSTDAPQTETSQAGKLPGSTPTQALQTSTPSSDTLPQPSASDEPADSPSMEVPPAASSTDSGVEQPAESTPVQQSDVPEQSNPAQQSDAPQQSNPPQQSDASPQTPNPQSEASPSVSFSFAPQTTQSVAPPAIIIGQSTVTQQSNSEFIIGSQTLVPGSSIVVGSGSSTTVVAIQTNDGGDAIVVVGSSSSLLQPQVTPAAQVSTAQAPPNIVIGDSTVTQQSDSAFIIDSQTLTPGGSVIVGSGASQTVIGLASNGNSAVIQAGSSSVIIPVETPAPAIVSLSTPAAAIVVGDSTITAQSGSAFVVSGQTLVPGASITVGDQVVRLQSDDSNFIVQVGSSTEVVPIPSAVPVTAAPPSIVVGDSTITANIDSAFVVSGQTLTPGGTITVSNGGSAEVVALQSTGSQLQVVYDGTSTATFAAAAVVTPAPSPAIVVGDSTITAQSGSTFVVSGQTLTPGATITVGTGSSAQVIALQTSNSELFVVYDGTSTSAVITPTPSPAITVGGNTITAQSGPTFIVSDQTLTPGGTITVDSTTLALQSSNSQLFVVYDGTSTSLLSPPTSLPAFTFASSLVTANSASAYVISGQTLLPGSSIIVDGTTISLASGASQLVIGTETVDLEATTTSGSGVGGYIWSAFHVESTSASSTVGSGRVTTASAASSPTAPAASTTGAGRRLKVEMWLGALCFALFALVM